MFRVFLVCSYAATVVCGVVWAGQPSLVQPGVLERQAVVLVDLAQSRPPIIVAPPDMPIPEIAVRPVAYAPSDDDRIPRSHLGNPSLFADLGPDSFFASPQRQYAGVEGLRALIASAEAGPDGYDAVQHGARIRPPAPPTQLTIGQIRKWIDDTPGQPHAIGRYQLIPPTFERLVRALDLRDTDRFSPRVQDRFADALLAEAGLAQYLEGKMRQTAFMNNMAKIWAGFPNETGRSHYHGYAGNKAVISWDRFRLEMDRIFPRG